MKAKLIMFAHMPASKPISTVKKRLIKSVTNVTNSSTPKKKKNIYRGAPIILNI